MQGRSGVIDRARRGGEAAAGVVAFIETAVTVTAPVTIMISAAAARATVFHCANLATGILFIKQPFQNPALLCKAGPLSWQALKTARQGRQAASLFRRRLDTTNPAGMDLDLRGGATELIEGGAEPKRIVILEFADIAAVKRWYNSPEYQKILPMRLDNSTGRAFIVEGVS
jgi:uncharacterized protein (DUF1330 family)